MSLGEVDDGDVTHSAPFAYPFDDGVELLKVSAPFVARQRLQRRRRETQLRCRAQLIEDVLDQKRDICTPLTQRWHSTFSSQSARSAACACPIQSAGTLVRITRAGADLMQSVMR